MARSSVDNADKLEAFRPRFPWYGGDLQTLRNYLARGDRDLTPWKGERVFFDAGDGSGDRLQGVLHKRSGGRMAVLVHGLTGCEASFYVLESAVHLLSAGYSVLRLNLRGAGPSRATCGGHYNAGSSEDLAAVLAQLPEGLARAGLVLAGYSLGGNVAIKYLAEAGERALPDCAVAVSPPMDLAAAARRMTQPRNFPYHRWLLRRMQAEAVADGAEISPAERDAIAAARTVVEFDDRFVAPRGGYEGAQDYYARCSTAGRLAEIRRPLLIVHADNDPWIPAASLPARGNDAVEIRLARGGGHVGFHGRGSRVPWHDLCLLEFAQSKVAPRPAF